MTFALILIFHDVLLLQVHPLSHRGRQEAKKRRLEKLNISLLAK